MEVSTETDFLQMCRIDKPDMTISFFLNICGQFITLGVNIKKEDT